MLLIACVRARGLVWSDSLGGATSLAHVSRVFSHDDFVLIFENNVVSEYVSWASKRMSINCTLIHQYWHAHHKYTADMWAVSTSSEVLGLGAAPFIPEQFVPGKKGGQTITSKGGVNLGSGQHEAHAANVTRHGFTIDETMELVYERIHNAQEQCRAKKCKQWPAVQCKLNQDRWETLPEGGFHERYHTPHCNGGWDLKVGDVFTIIAFHSRQEELAPGPPEYAWIHATFYALYISTDGSPIPHSYMPSPSA